MLVYEDNTKLFRSRSAAAQERGGETARERVVMALPASIDAGWVRGAARGDFRVCGSGSGVWGLGVGVWGLGSGVWGLGFGVQGS